MSLKKIVGAIAPVLASALPGPLGGVAKKVLADFIGKPEATEEEISKVLASANPEMLFKLKELDAKFKKDMAALGVDLERMSNEDRANARAMHVSLKDRTPPVLAWLITLGYVSLQTFLLFHGIPVVNHDLILRAMGLLDGALMMVLAFYFGSSASSHRKDETIQRIAESE